LQVLTVGQVALGRVVRINTMQASVEILATTSVLGETILLKEPQQGAIRREDVRAGASERVQIHESFLPGDLVICKVLALGDQRRYLLTTAAPELGVIYAESSSSGKQMVPSSWKEMSCPETGAKEFRKCARPSALTSAAGLH
jgi:exosome complex component CSL4